MPAFCFLRPVRFVVAVLATAAACASERAPTRLSHARAERIVSLGPSTTEILAALGQATKLVGRSTWDRSPASVLGVPDMGDALKPNVERVLAQRPDLVVAYAADDNAAALRAFRAAGVRVLALRIDTIREFLAAVDTLGAVVGAVSAADSITRDIQTALDRVRAARDSAPPVSVFLPVWEDPLMTLGAGSFLSELVAVAGGANVYADEASPSLTVSLEDVAHRDPDVVLTSPKGKARMLRRPSWRVLRAVREGHVLVYDTLLVSQPSTKLAEGAASLARLLATMRTR